MRGRYQNDDDYTAFLIFLAVIALGGMFTFWLCRSADNNPAQSPARPSPTPAPDTPTITPITAINDLVIHIRQDFEQHQVFVVQQPQSNNLLSFWVTEDAPALLRLEPGWELERGGDDGTTYTLRKGN